MKSLGITKKKFLIYMFAAFGLGWILQIIASPFFHVNMTLFTSIMVLAMFMPLLGILIARIPFKGMGWIPHLKGRIRYIFFSLYMPLILSIIGAVLYFAIFPDTIDWEFSGMRLQLEQAGTLEQLEAQGLTMPMYVIIGVIASVTYGPFINMFAALGEEVGWRGVMYPYLKEKLGVTKGRILGGALWGAWHWPVMILAGYEYGKEYFGAPVLGPIVFCISCIVLGILHDYVYEKTETIWMPALMHGAANCLSFLAYFCKPEYADRNILGPLSNGIIGMIPMIIVAVLICVKKKKRLAQGA